MFTRLRVHQTGIALAAAFGLALAPLSAAGAGRDIAMGGDGELYLLRQGTYGELFPGQGLADPGHSALALDVTRPGAASERILVPGTETADVEDGASILFEDQSGTLFLLWQSEINMVHWRLNLIGLRAGEWTVPIEVSGNPFGWKSSPQLAVTRDTFRTPEDDGSLRSWNRTVVHLLWWEEGAAGEPVVQYSPITLIDGVYTDWNPVYRLTDLGLGAGAWAPSLSPLNLALAESPKLEAGRNRHSVVLAFVNGSTNELTSLSLELLPGEIASIADKIRAQIIEVGRTLTPDGPGKLAAKVQDQVADLGARLGFHPGLTAYLANQTYAQVLAADPDEPVASLAERIRAQIIEVGARITDRGFGRLAEKGSLEVLEIADATGSGRSATLIRFLRASARRAPATGNDGVTVHLSPSGRDALVAWRQEGAVLYRESRGDDWSSTRSLRLSDELDFATAQAILAQRADERGGDE